MAAAMRKAQFVTDWMDMKPNIPIPRIDWIQHKALDLPYGDHPLQKLDLYFPNQGSTPYPLLIIIHGGGFTLMDKRDWHLYPGFFALQDGFALASINYRLAPKHQFPAAVNDTLAALDYLSANANRYQLDPANFCLQGTSAGGSLALLAAFRLALRAPEQNTSCSIRAIGALCPVTSLAALFTRPRQPNPFSFKLGRLLMRYSATKYLGRGALRDPERLRQAGTESGLTQLNTQKVAFPPTYFLQGDRDPLIPEHVTSQFYNQLRAASNLNSSDLVYRLLPGAGHAGGGPEFFETLTIKDLIAFYSAHLLPHSSFSHSYV
ncbi:MAG: alpha/beta hydrolase [Propionibacteriaceae bacterium]|jgi:acetyl esterase/lipase|nr:alpha/beta hydrolase [Propionibacteriaceae bacterium]